MKMGEARDQQSLSVCPVLGARCLLPDSRSPLPDVYSCPLSWGFLDDLWPLELLCAKLEAADPHTKALCLSLSVETEAL